VAEARTEAAKIRDDARADADRIKVELREQAEREVERIKQRGSEELTAQRDQVMRQLRAEIGAMSFETAQRIVRDTLADEGKRSATVDRFLGELDQMSGPGGTSGGSGAQAPAHTVSGGTH
jgi:F-type H+-transporting ATPase subunit b